VRTDSTEPLSVQLGRIPARQSGSPPVRLIKCGPFPLRVACHAKNPSAGIRARCFQNGPLYALELVTFFSRASQEAGRPW
jgi:hypothetical protein